jgi:uncharacterized paraquat-inducible protein A
MKTSIITVAVLLGLTAAAAKMLSVRGLVNADSILGFACVLTLLAVATLDYRINWKRIFSR